MPLGIAAEPPTMARPASTMTSATKKSRTTSVGQQMNAIFEPLQRALAAERCQHLHQGWRFLLARDCHTNGHEVVALLPPTLLDVGFERTLDGSGLVQLDRTK